MTEDERDELIGYWCVKCGGKAKTPGLIKHPDGCPADSFIRTGWRMMRLRDNKKEEEV